MEVHQLRYFCAVVETGSFTRAAAREHVAQPSLSQQIMKLEEELGARTATGAPVLPKLLTFVLDGKAALPSN